MPYNFNNDDFGFDTRHFVQKRELFLKIFKFLAFGLIVYVLLSDILSLIVPGGAVYSPSSKVLVIWCTAIYALGMYIRNKLSVCPVCHIIIPTQKAKRSDHMVPGTGPLPRRCPYCGTRFYD